MSDAVGEITANNILAWSSAANSVSKSYPFQSFFVLVAGRQALAC